MNTHGIIIKWVEILVEARFLCNSTHNHWLEGELL
jgi:hypothetical protein